MLSTERLKPILKQKDIKYTIKTIVTKGEEAAILFKYKMRD